MASLTKHLPFAFLVVVFFITRLYHLADLPMFTDEGLYARWVETIANDPRQWLIPLTEDGQPPLFIWLSLPLYHLTQDSLIALRLLSVFFGLGSMLGLMYVSFQITKRSSAVYLSGLEYILTPFVLWYDRLGMRESALSFVYLIGFLGLYRRHVHQSTRSNWLIATALVLGTSIKSLAWFLFPITVLSYLVFRTKPKREDYLWLIGGLVLPGLFFLLTHTTTSLVNKNSIFITNPTELFTFIKPNLIQIYHWLWEYLTPTLLLVIIVSQVWLIKLRQPLARLSLLFLMPIVIEVVIAKIFFPRYFLFTIPIFLLGASLALSEFWDNNRLGFILIIIPILVETSTFTRLILTDPTKAPLPAIEKWQYISGWPSGYGLQELAAIQLNLEPDLIITETTDVTRTGLGYYRPGYKPIITALDQKDEVSPQLANEVEIRLSQNQIVLLVLNRLDELPAPLLSNGVMIQAVRPHNGKSIRLYRITGVKDEK